MSRRNHSYTLAAKHPNVSSFGDKCCSFTRSFLPVAVGLGILFVILGLHIYYTSVISENNAKRSVENQQLKTNLTDLNSEKEVLRSDKDEMKIKKLIEENQQLKTNLADLNNTLSSENEELRRDKDEQTIIIGNLTEAYNDSEMKIKNLTADIEELETDKDELTKQIRNTENCNTVTQEIIDDYCPIKNGNRKCKPCPDGWLLHQSYCYQVNDPNYAGQLTWEEAREHCGGTESDLPVIVNEDEKTFISDNSRPTAGVFGYWIGLRAVAGKWKWISGNHLAEKSWMTEPAVKSYCGITVQDQGLKSVNCDYRRGWICKKKAVSV